MTTTNEAPLMRLEQVAKTFPNGTVALRGVDLRIGRGKVHGLLGAHRAGKSTLIKILSGSFSATRGGLFRRKPARGSSRPEGGQARRVAPGPWPIPSRPLHSLL